MLPPVVWIPVRETFARKFIFREKKATALSQLLRDHALVSRRKSLQKATYYRRNRACIRDCFFKHFSTKISILKNKHCKVLSKVQKPIFFKFGETEKNDMKMKRYVFALLDVASAI